MSRSFLQAAVDGVRAQNGSTHHGSFLQAAANAARGQNDHYLNQEHTYVEVLVPKGDSYELHTYEVFNTES